jgi:dynein heavy chain
MVETIHKIMKHGNIDYNNVDRKIWVMKHPGQVVASISQVQWSLLTEQYIMDMEDNPFAMKDWL